MLRCREICPGLPALDDPLDDPVWTEADNTLLVRSIGLEHFEVGGLEFWIARLVDKLLLN